jgi:putative ubiquitin-RnfH superfamily antitoxin RatB of RatAB toxin-antitoxin module
VKVSVVWVAPGVQDVVALTLPPGATVADAVARSGFIERYAQDVARLGFAVFGRRAKAGTALVEGDRVEIVRPLVADPKESRRRRAEAQTRPGDARHRR